MSNDTLREDVELVKNLLKELHRGASPERLREMFREVLQRVPPFKIPLIEQELVREGIPVKEILSLCDLHVELFREMLKSVELRDVPRGHPLDLLVRENEWILKQAEALGVYAQALISAESAEVAMQYIKAMAQILLELKRIRLHYRKVQMLIFPYLERAGIDAVPRVLWGREDQVLVKLRSLVVDVNKAVERPELSRLKELAKKAIELSREIGELVFRENKILYPATYALLPEGAWTVIAEISREIGYLVETPEGEWKPTAKPLYPYEWDPLISQEQLEKLPKEFKAVATRLQPDTCRIKREGDIEFETGFLTPEEIEGIFRSLPLELTYADANDRVRFYTKSDLSEGFVRTKTILGRKIPYCHPPRLENYVMLNVDALKRGEFKYREFWTRLGDRVIRVIIAPVKGKRGEILGILEVVEDLTEVVERPEDIKKKIMVL